MNGNSLVANYARRLKNATNVFAHFQANAAELRTHLKSLVTGQQFQEMKTLIKDSTTTIMDDASDTRPSFPFIVFSLKDNNYIFSCLL